MANEMRDRLVELIQDALFQHAHYVAKERQRALESETEAEHSEIYDNIKYLNEYIADHLIANGVIVPPCKAGDKVWYITTSYMTKVPKVQKGYVEKIIITQNGIDLIADNYVSKLTYGKRSFLTKAEAEQKLKEMRGGNAERL